MTSSRYPEDHLFSFFLGMCQSRRFWIALALSPIMVPLMIAGAFAMFGFLMVGFSLWGPLLAYSNGGLTLLELGVIYLLQGAGLIAYWLAFRWKIMIEVGLTIFIWGAAILIATFIYQFFF